MENNQILITQKEFNKLKIEIKNAKDKGKKIVYSSEDDELNRKVIEKLEIDILVINQKARKDFQKQRNSGFNQVMAKIMKKKKIILGINIDELIEESNQRKKAEILGRIRQNIFICKKNNVQINFISLTGKNKRNNYDIKSLGLVLGIPTKITKQF